MSHGCRWERFSNKLAIASMAAVLAGGSAAMAQEAPAAAAPAPAPNTGAISVSAGLDVITEYIWRGIPQQDQGVIFQPTATITASLWSSGDYSLSAFVNSWNSIHSEDTAPNAGNHGWFEGDWTFGASVGLPGGFTVTPSFVIYHSPNGAWGETQEIDVNVAYDDAPLWGDTGIPGWAGIKPYALVAFETTGGADVLGKSGELGTYLELGIAPSFTLIQSQDYPVTISFPVKLGLGLDNYYEHVKSTGAIEDETYGYLDGGIMFSVPLAFIPAQFGSWEAHAGVHFVDLNGAYVNDAVAPNYDEFRILGTAGVSMSY